MATESWRQIAEALAAKDGLPSKQLPGGVQRGGPRPRGCCCRLSVLCRHDGLYRRYLRKARPVSSSATPSKG